MASSTECPLFPKPRKGKGQSQKQNKKRNDNTQENSAFITPGLSFAQVTSGQNSQQRAARGSDSTTSNSENKKNKSFNSETLNHINCQGGDFSFLKTIFEMKKIFDLFPNLISEMKKSSKCTDPTDKLQCLLKGTTGPVQPEVGAVLRSSLKDRFPIFMFPSSPPLTGVEATLVVLTPSDQEPFLVASIYAPPGPNYRNLGADLDGIFNIFKSAFLAGDYNAKHTSWGCNTATPETAVVIPILKPDKNSALAESYRPISLLPVLSKLAEKVILTRLNDHLERENILIPEQHGFRPRLSTSHQLLRVVEFIKEGNKDECTAAVFLDIQKAFDRDITQPFLQMFQRENPTESPSPDRAGLSALTKC
ncbi:putative RNA-directed DNA polymerase from transposon BS [Trichonephila clavipes]|nr:putative RNA-directed DNA polymerase from transposon BS [Trichonephila clavipes]